MDQIRAAIHNDDQIIRTNDGESELIIVHPEILRPRIPANRRLIFPRVSPAGRSRQIVEGQAAVI